MRIDILDVEVICPKVEDVALVVRLHILRAVKGTQNVLTPLEKTLKQRWLVLKVLIKWPGRRLLVIILSHW